MDLIARLPAATAIVNAPQPRPTDEQLIGALNLAPLDRPRPDPAPLPTLPTRRRPDADAVQLDAAQVDPSGRTHIRGLIDALDWRPSQHVSLDVVYGVVVIRLDPVCRSALGGRGTLVLPAAIRRMAGIDRGATVIAAADPAIPALFVHPERVVALLLTTPHRRVTGGPHG